LTGAAGGVLLTVLHVPAGWLCGAALSVAIAAIAGRPMTVPNRLRDVIFIVLGTSMGSALSPQTLTDAQSWPLSIVLLLVSVAATMTIGSWYLRTCHGWDVATARLSSTPGALSAVLILAGSTTANFPVVALSQTMRQFVLISLMPVALLLGGSGVPAIAAPSASLIDMAYMLIAGSVGAFIASRIKMPGGLLIGAMLASSILHVTGTVVGRLDPDLLTIAYVLMGCLIGSRFRGTKVLEMRRVILPAFGAIGITVAVSLVFAIVCHVSLGLPFAEIWLAFAPGGVEAMTVMAYALNLDPSYVSAHHVIRLVALIMLSPIWTASLTRLAEPASVPRG
jgi:membrane AbrB-like protein